MGVRIDEVRSLGKIHVQAGRTQTLGEDVALAGQRRGRVREKFVVHAQPGGNGSLERGAGGVAQELLHGPGSGHEFRRAGQPADLPTREGERLPGGRDGERSLGGTGQRCHGYVPGTKRQVLIHLIGEDDGVVLDGQAHHFAQHLHREHGAGRVVRIVDDDHLGARAEAVFKRGQVRHEVRGEEGCGGVAGAAEADHGTVGVVKGLEREDFIPWAGQGQDCGGDGLRGAGGNDDLGFRVQGEAVETVLMLSYCAAQVEQAFAGGVLVLAAGDGFLGEAAELGRAVLIREALA